MVSITPQTPPSSQSSGIRRLWDDFYRDYALWTGHDVVVYSGTAGAVVTAIIHRWATEPQLRHDAVVILSVCLVFVVGAALFSSNRRTRFLIIALLLLSGSTLYNLYDRSYPPQIPGQLTDGQKWRLASAIRSFGPYPLNVSYYSEQSKIGMEILQCVRAGGWPVASQLAPNEQLEGITVQGRKNNPNVRKLADTLSDAYGGQNIRVDEEEGTHGDILHVLVGSQ
jgi:hypothetical protein